ASSPAPTAAWRRCAAISRSPSSTRSPRARRWRGSGTGECIAFATDSGSSMRKGTLADFFAASPLAGSDLKIERVKGGDRKIDLDAGSEAIGGADEDARSGDSRNPAHPNRGERR